MIIYVCIVILIVGLYVYILFIIFVDLKEILFRFLGDLFDLQICFGCKYLLYIGDKKNDFFFFLYVNVVFLLFLFLFMMSVK